MVFNSFEFLLFFPVVSVLYFCLPHRMRWGLLLAASCLFYMAFIPKYILILGFTIVVDYFAGIWIENAQGKRKKWFLILSLAANIGILAYYKYFHFLVENINALSHVAGWQHDFVLKNIILPIGLSFHTFQAMSYTIEVYRGGQKAERHFGIYALYVMFYPQLVAGPIERPQNLLHQFREEHNFDYHRVTSGLKLMAWGLFKKVVIADRLAMLVDAVYKDTTAHSGFMLVLATLAFGYQIYCDFSGYTDIAIGSAEVMGFRLMKNFRQPYHAHSVSDFWRRWHISLSTWFKDYLYIPLGGNRCSKARQWFNLFATFVVSGLWHGAEWTYVAWGALHGGVLGCSMLTSGLRTRFTNAIGLTRFPTLHLAIQILITYIIVNIGWVFFRAHNFTDAIYVLTHMHQGWDVLGRPMELFSNLQLLQFGPSDVFYVFISMVVLKFAHQLQRRGSVREMIARQPFAVRWAIYWTGLASLVLLGVWDRPSFIYFQF